MKSRTLTTALGGLWLLTTLSCFGWITTHDVTAENQKELGLDFSITIMKHKHNLIVDFVVPPAGALSSLERIGVFDNSSGFTNLSGLSVPFLGLTRFPRDTQSTPKHLEWVRGIRLWVGEQSITNVVIQFEHNGELYSIHLDAYVLHQAPDESKSTAQPGSAANGSQPIRSETNRTSSAAGSRR